MSIYIFNFITIFLSIYLSIYLCIYFSQCSQCDWAKGPIGQGPRCGDWGRGGHKMQASVGNGPGGVNSELGYGHNAGTIPAMACNHTHHAHPEAKSQRVNWWHPSQIAAGQFAYLSIYLIYLSIYFIYLCTDLHTYIHTYIHTCSRLTPVQQNRDCLFNICAFNDVDIWCLFMPVVIAAAFELTAAVVSFEDGVGSPCKFCKGWLCCGHG